TYPLDGLSFVANAQAEAGAVTLTFRAYGDSENCAGQVRIAIEGAAAVSWEASLIDLTWHVTAGDVLRFDRNDFRDFFRDRASADEKDAFRYLTFQPDASFNPDNGYLYYDFEGKGQKEFTFNTLGDASFFYSSSRYGSYPISGLTFLAANEGGGKVVSLPFTVFGRTERFSGTLAIQIDWAKAAGIAPAPPAYGPPAPTNATSPSGTASVAADAASANETPIVEPETTQTPSATEQPATTEVPAVPATPAEPDILYLVRAGERVEFSAEDFSVPAQTKLNGTLRYVTFSASDELSQESGWICADVGGLEEVSFTTDTIRNFRFYAESDRYGDYSLASLYFAAPVTAPARTVRLSCTLHDSSRNSAVIAMSIELQAADPSQLEARSVVDDDETPSATTPAAPEPETATPPPTVPDDPVTTTPEEPESVTTPEEPENVTTTPDEPDAGTTPPEPETPSTPAEPEPPSGTTEEPTPVQPDKPAPFNITEPFTGTPVQAGNILYATTWNTPLRLVSDDFDRFFRKAFPGGTISHVNLTGLPQYGRLYYDYYSSSPYGDADRLALQAESLAYTNFYYSPAYTDRYSLAELTYVPEGETNLCDSLPFSATGIDADGNMVQCTGTALVSVTKALIADVYGAIPKGRTVTFPADNLDKNVTAGVGKSMNGFRFLALPDSSVGSIGVGDSNAPANTEQIYHWTDIQPKVNALHFIPDANYTGSVDIPYLVVDGDANAVGIGHFTLGVISTLKRFSDVTSSVWCYKYVTELAAAGVVGGYGDDTYRPDISVTWGAALKLIMLAAGYDEQPGNSMTPFQGYLDKALEDHLIPKEIDLWEPVTRLEVAELAAAAMRLDTDHLSSVQPFSDTDNASVQALNAAGIINGYYNEGINEFRPAGTLNRGQAAAIVWRMRNYRA
ncbi:MAG: S-layer homology domain-containing protein, partial [Oscillospiraceae bacterium]|nr:S-layer homology domain-containing protein [Oscillospiraceae bacterium]